MQNLLRAKEYVQSVIGDFSPEIGIVLGSGLNSVLQDMQIIAKIPYSDIVNFPVSGVAGHIGCYNFGFLRGRACVVMQGRVHYYEGYTMQQVVMPIRLMGLLGIKTLLLTNAAGGMNSTFSPGDIMLICDHISSFVPSPLLGENLDELGPRFPDMTQVYSIELQETVCHCAELLNIPLHKGIFVQLSGPQYETPAEIRMLKALGADAIGMSTVCEAIAARHMGIDVCGLSCITNMAAGLNAAPLSHQEVQQAGLAASDNFAKLIGLFVDSIPF